MSGGLGIGEFGHGLIRVRVGWNCYLSYVNSQAGKKETVGEKVKEKAEEIS